MATKCMDAHARAYIPDLGVVIEGPRDQLIPLRVERQRPDLRGMPHQRAQLRARLHIPQLGGVVHGSRGNDGGLWVE